MSLHIVPGHSAALCVDGGEGLSCRRMKPRWLLAHLSPGLPTAGVAGTVDQRHFYGTRLAL
jgi:hypothetical protein